MIVSEGSANFNLRVLPDDDVTAIVKMMGDIAAEPGVTVELTSEPSEPPPPSPVTTALFQAMETSATAMAPGVTATIISPHGVTL
jgi:acetylornithine deacetylase/succinyl-diaminopimelate desuccinylase-like protein